MWKEDCVKSKGAVGSGRRNERNVLQKRYSWNSWIEWTMSILADLRAMVRRENLSLRDQAALALALAMLDVEPPRVSREVYRLLPHKIELLDGVVVLSEE